MERGDAAVSVLAEPSHDDDSFATSIFMLAMQDATTVKCKQFSILHTSNVEVLTYFDPRLVRPQHLSHEAVTG